MNVDAHQFAFSFAAGNILGVFYFGGLWLTVRIVHQVKHPAMLVFISFVARNAVALPGFYWVMDGHWERMFFCLLGFLAVRYLLIHLIRSLGPVPKASERGS